MSVLYFMGLLTFPVPLKNVQKGRKSEKIQHIVLAKNAKREYTSPCLRGVEMKAGQLTPFRIS